MPFTPTMALSVTPYVNLYERYCLRACNLGCVCNTSSTSFTFTVSNTYPVTCVFIFGGFKFNVMLSKIKMKGKSPSIEVQFCHKGC